MTVGVLESTAEVRQPPVNRWPVYALLSANAISTVGNMLTAITVPWLVLEMTGSAARTGISGFVAEVADVAISYQPVDLWRTGRLCRCRKPG